MVVRRAGEAPHHSSSEDSGGSWHQRPAPNMPNRHTINRQVALNTLAAMHRRFSLPSIINTNGRPLAEFRASANKSLDLLRQNIQAAVTKDIDQVIKKYLEKFFVPAVNNIRTNLGEESVSEEQLRAVCRAMLDGARSLYAAPPRPSVPTRPAPSPSELSDSESSNGADSRFGRPSSSPSYGKRKESDTDSDVGVGARRKRRVEGNANYAHKWDPARLTQDTLFIMGSIANKVLGLGQSRGRLYSKHAGLLRYPADSADKEWIANQNLKTSSGGRTYIMVLEDIEELIVSEDYRHSSSLRLSELSCFRAPPFMLRKIQAYLCRRSEMSEEYASSTPTPTPPPMETLPNNTVQAIIKQEHIEDPIPFDSSAQAKATDDQDNLDDQLVNEQLVNDPYKTIKTEIEEHQQHNQNNQCLSMNQIKPRTNQHLNTISGNFTSIVSTGISSVDDSFWKSVTGNQLLNETSKDTFDGNIKVELNSAAELMDTDIEFLSGDFCSYAESEAEVKKSFDKLTDGDGGMFITGDNSNMLTGRIQQSDINNVHSINMNQSLPDTHIQKPSLVSSLVGNIAVGSIPSDVVHTYVSSTNPPLMAMSGSSNLQPSQSNFAISQVSTSQTLPSFSQIAPLQAHLISSQTQPFTIQASCVTCQSNIGQTTTRTVYSLANTTRTLTTTITPGSTFVGIGNRTSVAGNILATGGSFINITPKNFSTGNILHNAIVSRNMVNRGLNTNKIDISKPTQSNLNSVAKAPLILPSVSTFSRTAVSSKIDLTDDASITTTKAMIDNTCNSSAMLKQVLTLGSAGVNKTFLSPPMQKMNVNKPSSSASSNLSASHATLSALLSGIDPGHSDKKNSYVLSKGDK